MATHTRKTRRLKLPSEADAHAGTARDRRIRVGVAAGVAALLLVVILVAAASIAGVFGSSGSQPLPDGIKTFTESDHTHVTGAVSYDRVPPAGGPHNATPLNCGIYAQPVANENAVHSLEHGAVWITYQPNLPADQLAQLRQLVTSSYVGSQRYLILSPYPGIPSPMVASAWGAQLGVEQASDSRLSIFIHTYAGGGQGGEQGAECSGGVGSPIG